MSLNLGLILTLLTFLAITTIPVSKAFLCSNCFNGTKITNTCNKTNIIISQSYDQTAYIPVVTNDTHLTYQVTYSLTPFPNSIPFSCGPNTRFKAFTSFMGSFLIPNVNQSYVIDYYINNLEDLILTDPPTYRFKLTGIFTSFVTNSIIKYKNPLNFNLLIPNDCSKIGDYLNTTVLSSSTIKFDENLEYKGTSLTCNVKTLDCGYEMRQVLNATCCTVGNVIYTLPNCTLIDDSYEMSNCTCNKKPDPFNLVTWITATSVTGSLLFLIIIGLLIAFCCCVSSTKYIRT
jgi:hypothetical protein